MKIQSQALLIVLASGIGLLGQGYAQDIPAFLRTTPGYRHAALKRMLAEVNLYAKRLHLPEEFPITNNSLVKAYLVPSRLSAETGALGNLYTTNYSYAFGRGKRLTYITRLPKDKSHKSLYEKFKPWKIDPSEVNTNAAYLIATQMLAEAFVNLPSLLRSTTVSIHPITILNMTTSVYDVEWKHGGQNVAEVGLEQPTKELWLLRVEDPKYILRKPIGIGNSARVLSRKKQAEKANESDRN